MSSEPAGRGQSIRGIIHVIVPPVLTPLTMLTRSDSLNTHCLRSRTVSELEIARTVRTNGQSLILESLASGWLVGDHVG